MRVEKCSQKAVSHIKHYKEIDLELFIMYIVYIKLALKALYT